MILFIDDEPVFNESYVEILEENGYKVYVATDMNDAIDMLKTKMSSIQLIILDIMFDIPENPPEGFDIIKAKHGSRSGEAFLEILNKLEKAKDIPKIILTNVSDENFYQKYNDRNIVKGCYRKKHTSVENLLEIVNRNVTKK